MKRVPFILLLLFSLSAVVSCGKPSPVPTRPVPVVHPEEKDPENPLTELKVMSFNVRGSKGEDDPFNAWDNRKAACVEMLQIQHPDIVGFQEADYSYQWTFFKEKFAKEYDSYGLPGQDARIKGSVNGFLYNKLFLKVLSCGTFWQSDTPDVPSLCYNDGYYRQACWALFQVRGTLEKFLYINTHMALKSEAQQSGLAVLLAKMKDINPSGYPMILTGDFNMVPSSQNLKPLRAIMMDTRDVAPSALTDNDKTYNAWGDKNRATVCDYVWITPDISCLEYHTDRQPYSGHTYISDHYPIYAKIKLNNQ